MAINTAVLSNVYNYYQADLVPRSSSNRFDSHKKKDLQDIYKSIVKISKDEPVFLMDRSKDVEEYTINMKENAMKFRSEVGTIGGLDDATIFNQKTAFSSDSEIAEVLDRGSNTQRTGEESEPVELLVLPVPVLDARGRIRGTALEPEDLSELWDESTLICGGALPGDPPFLRIY